MNWKHFRAFLWLRWRIRYNQMRRAGAVNAALYVILAVGGIFLSLFLFAAALLLGVYGLGEVSPLVLLLVWDGFTVGFLFAWTVGLVADLQRSEVLSMDKFMHLPVSLTGVFLINYLSSLVNLTLILFAPPMFGLVIGLAISRGATLLWALPAVAAFLLMVTALTNQFQGWLATLLTNKRRRRTVITVVTLTFVLLAQLPNLFVQTMMGVEARMKKESAESPERQASALLAEQVAVGQDLLAGRITGPQAKERHAEIARTAAALPRVPAAVAIQVRAGLWAEHIDAAEDLRAGRITGAQAQERFADVSRKLEELSKETAAAAGQVQAGRQALQQYEPTIRILNLALPPGWLSVGVADAATGVVWPALLAAGGLGLIGTASLWRSYRSTLRLYSGQLSARARKATKAAPAPAVAGDRERFLERRLPLVSEPVAAIALSSFRSLVRAPEAKMMLLSPVILAIVFGTILLRNRDLGAVPPPARLLMASGAMTAVLFGMLQMIGNQFGFDRNGFRVFVLCGARRRDILLGKNLAFAPLALTLGLLVAAVLQSVYPMPADLFLSVPPMYMSMFLLFCLLTNLLSILAPMPVAPGTLRPVNPKLVPILLHISFMLFLFPVTMSLTLAPLGVEFLLRTLHQLEGVPVCLLLTLVECPLVVLLYYGLLIWQGELLHLREQKVLETVAIKAE